MTIITCPFCPHCSLQIFIVLSITACALSVIQQTLAHGLPGLYLMSVKRGDVLIRAVGPEFVLVQDDVLYFTGMVSGNIWTSTSIAEPYNKLESIELSRYKRRYDAFPVIDCKKLTEADLTWMSSRRVN